MAENNLPQGNKTIGPLTGCMLEEALALVWDVFSDFESENLPQEALDEFWARIDYEYMLQRAGDGEIRFWGAFDDDFLVGVCVLPFNTLISLDNSSCVGFTSLCELRAVVI